MIRRSILRVKRRGAVMLLAAFAIVLLLLTGVGVLSLGQTTRIFAIRRASEVAARTAADAGLTKAVWSMNQEIAAGDWDGRDVLWEFRQQLPNSEATYSFISKKVNHYYGGAMPSGNDDLRDFFHSISGGAGDYVVMSVGTYAGFRKVVYGIVGLQGLGNAGILVRDTIVLKAGTLIDGRDSRDPGNLNPDVLVEIGTISTADGAIILNNGVNVDGNVLVGVGGNVDTVITDHGATTDLKYPFPEEPSMPFVAPPFGLPDRGWLNVNHGQTMPLTEADNGRYSAIDLRRAKTPAVLEIASGDVVLYITGDITMGQDCEIVIREGATLNLYVDGNIFAGNNSGFNNLGTPPDFKLWGNWRGTEVDQQWQLNAKSEYFGLLYAPNADVIVHAKGDLYGAFTAENFEMKNGGDLFYDDALRDVNPNEAGVRFVLKRWMEQ